MSGDGRPFGGHDTMVEVEDLATRAWPPTISQDLEGWELRWSMAPTFRTNSVRPAKHEKMASLVGKVRAAESFYERHGRPTLFQITPLSQPPNLDLELDHQGYEQLDASLLQIASMISLAQINDGWPEVEIAISTRLTHEWIALWIEFSQTDGASAESSYEILNLVTDASVFLTLEVDGTKIGVARGVAAGRWLGIFNMATSPGARNRGAGKALLRSLSQWAQARGASDAYLQVDADNKPARRLYETAGFRTLYEYWYRIKSLSYRR